MIEAQCGTCGGLRGHVGWCPRQQEQRQQEAAQRERTAQQWRDEQARLRRGLIGDCLAGVEYNDGYSIKLTFLSGCVLTVKQTGGELDGHGEYSTRYVRAVVE